jgi:hypothetical protein
LGAQLNVIVDLAVENESEIAVLRRHRLMSAFEIDDGKAAVPEKNCSVVPQTAVIRPAVGEHGSHARQRFAVACANETGDAAHLVPSVQFGPRAARRGNVPGAGDQVSHLILRLVIRPGDQFRK